MTTTIGNAVAIRQARAADGRLSNRQPPELPSKYIAYAPDVLKSGMRILSVCRVSNRERRRNLQDQEANLRRGAAEFGCSVAGNFSHVGSGNDPWPIGRAVAMAKEFGACALYLETTDRGVRPPAYHSSKNPDAQARKSDLEELSWWADGMLIVTDLHPDATPAEVRSYQRRRGQWAKGHYGGRPRRDAAGELKTTARRRYAPAERAELESRARGLLLGGRSERSVAAELDLKISTLRSWLWGRAQLRPDDEDGHGIEPKKCGQIAAPAVGSAAHETISTASPTRIVGL